MWEQAESGCVRTPFEPLILAATLAMIPVIVIERDVSTGAWKTVGAVANWLIWAVFAVELAFVLVKAPRKTAAFRAHWLDAAIVVVTLPLYGRLLSSLSSCGSPASCGCYAPVSSSAARYRQNAD